MNNKVYIVDKLVIGYNHVLFNSTISAMLANIYNDQPIVFICESLHANIVSEINYKQTNISYKKYDDTPLPANILKRLYPWIKKKVGDVLYIKKLFKSTFFDAESIFFTCLSTTSLLVAAKLAKNYKKPVYFFIHGEIEYLFIKNDRLINKIKAIFYRAFLKQIGGRTKVITLSENVRQELIKQKILHSNQIINIDHPVIAVDDLNQVKNAQIPIFGHLGIATRKKSSQLFFNLAKRNRCNIKEGVVEFQLIGTVENDLSSVDFGGTTILTQDRKLSQKEYTDYVNAIDYAVFTFTGDNYIYRVSGTVADAIAHCKPIIALNHKYFEYLFNKAGNIGFLCKDIDEMDFLISRIVSKDKELLNQYPLQQTNLINLLQQLSIEKTERKLESVLL